MNIIFALNGVACLLCGTSIAAQCDSANAAFVWVVLTCASVIVFGWAAVESHKKQS